MTNRRRSTWRAGLAGGAVALAVAAFYLLRGGEPAVAAPPAARPLPVPVVDAEAVESVSETRHYTGELRARRTSDVGFSLGGELEELAVTEGGAVAAGDLLARLDTRRIEARRRELRARLAGAEARLAELEAGPRSEVVDAARADVDALTHELALARLKTERRELLAARDAVSAESRDEAVFAQRTLDARLASAGARLAELEAGTREELLLAQSSTVEELRAGLELVEIELEDSRLTAPFDGTVAAHYLDPGAVVAAGTPVVRLVEAGALEAWIGVPVDAARELPEGASVELDVEGSANEERTVEARVQALLPEVDPATRTRTAVLALESSADLAAGQTARLALEREVEVQGLEVPFTALHSSSRGLWTLFVVPGEGGGDAELERRDVELIHTDGERAFVRGALSAGDRVVADGTHRVVDGQLVTPIQR